MSNVYEYQAALIERSLSAHRVPARVWQATVTPRFVRFDVTTGIGVPVGRATRLDAEVAMALGVPSVRIWRDGGALAVVWPLGPTARIAVVITAGLFVPAGIPMILGSIRRHVAARAAEQQRLRDEARETLR